jgi:hypothetical protein
VVLTDDGGTSWTELEGGQVQGRAGGDDHTVADGGEVAAEQEVGQPVHPRFARRGPQPARPGADLAAQSAGATRRGVQDRDLEPRVVREPGDAPAAEQADQLHVVREREVVAEVHDRAGHAPAAERVEDEDVDAQRLSP